MVFPPVVFFYLFSLLLLGCSNENDLPVDSVGTMCDEPNSIEGEWFLREVSIDELGGTEITGESGSLIFGCNGTYTEDYSFVLGGNNYSFTDTGEWTSDTEDQVVMDLIVTFTRVSAGDRTTWLTENFDNSPLVDPETTRLIFEKK
ncbi:hypothetical protein GW915_10320 [bacterium]|nr:hypothetical protein [bacterium]